MNLRSVLEDCLYLNWALPREVLPEPPTALRYDARDWEGGEAVFGSALFFRQRGFRLNYAPLIRLSYLQCQLQLCTLDRDGTPSVWIRSVLLPGWVAPGARWIAGQPARAAVLSVDSAAGEEALGRARWRVDCRGRLAVTTQPASPELGSGPVLGNWRRTVSYFSQRPNAYSLGRRGLRRIELDCEEVTVVPVRAEIEDRGLLAGCLGLEAAAGGGLPALHSAWVCPPMVASLLLLRDAEPAPGTQEVPIPGV